MIEDAAQSFGSKWREQFSGALGTVGCFSAHPLKNLNACGDSGFITTDKREIATKIRLMRNHGLIDRNNVESFGMVSRMDALQSAILEFRLSNLASTIDVRRRNARQYQQLLDPDVIYFPTEREEEFNHHQKRLTRHQLTHQLPLIRQPLPIVGQTRVSRWLLRIQLNH